MQRQSQLQKLRNAIKVAMQLVLIAGVITQLPASGQCRRYHFLGQLTSAYAGEALQQIQSSLTLAKTIEKYGKSARLRYMDGFTRAKVPYPPAAVTLIGLKDEKLLLVFARGPNGPMKQVNTYSVIGTSGDAGPKLKEGDLQIPEGFYKITALQPNSIAHLALRVDYPNAFDRAKAKLTRRTNLGGDIEIHGSFWSTGCLAMGNTAIEELFVLTHDTGCKNVRLILSPCDLTSRKPDVSFKGQPKWLPELYKELSAELRKYPMEKEPGWLHDIHRELQKKAPKERVNR